MSHITHKRRKDTKKRMFSSKMEDDFYQLRMEKEKNNEKVGV